MFNRKCIALGALLMLAACRPVDASYEPEPAPPATTPEPPKRISFVHGAGQHDPEKWGQVSVGYLLMWHANKMRHLARGYSILRYGPNPEHVGAHRKDTRTEVSR